ncbi:MAG TPA: PQQ-binding-like beta-propeller repeat protein [Polyangia bacterium]
MPGELVAYDGRLHELWRARVELLSFGDLRPVALGDDAFACIGAPIAGGAVDSFHGRLVVASAASGGVRWARDLFGGVTQPEPIAAGPGVVAGVDPTLFAAADGAVRWKVSSSGAKIETGHPPALVGQRLLYPGVAGALVSVALADGAAAPGPHFDDDPTAVVLALGLAPDGALLVSSRNSQGPRLTRLPTGP